MAATPAWAKPVFEPEDKHEEHHEGDDHSQDQPRTFKPIIIYPDKSIDSHRHDTTDRIQVMGHDKIAKSRANSLAELVDEQPGIDTQDYCVNCGAKRLTINGMRGEHTSILVDGIPLYSSVTSVYGLDTIPSLAIEEIEVMRGSGSALINPEAIGGALNLFSIHPQETGGQWRSTMGSYQSHAHEVLYSHVGDNVRWSLGLEYNGTRAWDVDKNGVSESPDRERLSFFGKQTWTISDRLQWSVRVGHADLEIIGGNTQKFRPSGVTPTQADDLDFVGGDVRLPFIGQVAEITDYLKIRRTEGTSKLQYILTPSSALEFNVGSSYYTQDSLYAHGFDYDIRNSVLYSDVRWNKQLSPSHSLLIGLSHRREILRSDSQVMYEQNGLAKDNFNYASTAAFTQYEWILGAGWELTSALRADRVSTRWLELNSIEETMLAPRFLLKWEPSEHFSNYFAYGRGYRMPLTFVESAHGTYDEGFLVDIRELETSDSFMLSTSYNTPEFYITPSLHHTILRHMAYDIAPAVAHSAPLRFVNSAEDFNITVYELLGGVKPLPGLLIELGQELFQYEDLYKRRLPTAAIEARTTLKAQWDWNSYQWNLSGVFVPSRNIGKYSNYEDHFNINEGLLGADSLKRQRSPDYFLWNTSLTKQADKWQATVGVDNIFDETQTRRGDSPAMWHVHDGHAHFDNRHVWGPNRGREYYLRLTFNF